MRKPEVRISERLAVACLRRIKSELRVPAGKVKEK